MTKRIDGKKKAKSRVLVLLSVWLVLMLAHATRAEVPKVASPLDAAPSKTSAKPQPVTASLVADVSALLPGKTINLAVKFSVTKGFYTFAHEKHEKSINLPTVITFKAPDGYNLGEWQFPPHEVKTDAAGGESIVSYVYKKDTAVVASLTPPATLVPGSKVTLQGKVKYQFCKEGGACYSRNDTVSLEIPVVAADAKVEASADAALIGAAFAKPGNGATEAGSNQAASSATNDYSLYQYLLFAFLGGLILNVMPCVLPVIAIKVLGFVQQAGESRSRILLLNLAYSAGIVVVFEVLATLAVVAGYGWGGLFQRPEFNIGMAALVFSMGLSLLGVFEIPVPGLLGGGGAEHREGLTGAFFTGIFATLLATPCSGPFLGVTLGWSVRQAPTVTYLVWTFMGLGMASPYVVFGLYPKALARLPKPGNWMITFKQVCGFVLLGTVIFILTFLGKSYTFPMLVFLLALGFSLWLVGSQIDFNSTPKQIWTIRGAALATTVLVGMGAFGTIASPESKLAWQSFDDATFKKLLEDKKTVLVDFSADWCLTCKTNEYIALNRGDTKQLVAELGVVPLYADYTEESAEIQKWLKHFDSISVPLTIIVPAGRLEETIVLRDLYSKNQLLESLRQAGAKASQPQAARMGESQTR